MWDFISEYLMNSSTFTSRKLSLSFGLFWVSSHFCPGQVCPAKFARTKFAQPSLPEIQICPEPNLPQPKFARSHFCPSQICPDPFLPRNEFGYLSFKNCKISSEIEKKNRKVLLPTNFFINESRKKIFSL